jgi:DNA-directed RNA polymerase specialized sigma24 family protein
MVPITDLTTFNLNFIRQRCAHESNRFFNRQPNDPRYCYELFRRALLEKDQRAWEFVFEQYQRLVSGWVERHATFPETGEDNMYFVNATFSRLWRVITPEKFSRFPDLKSILRYLQLCVNGCLVDYLRSKDRAIVLEDEALETVVLSLPNEPNPEDLVVERSQVDHLWNLLEERLKDEQEQIVAYASFVLALKPSELLTEYPHAFRNIQEIYRTKENLLARLRRDADFMDYLSQF